MEWESPWGLGFPGWHIECSAMSVKALGETFDIHTGGIDHINVHHTNEIIQSEAASGKRFVNYWVHHAFLLVDGAKMSKSLGNTYTVTDIATNGFDPLTLRYLFLETHYRQEMNFTWEAIRAAQVSLERLTQEIAGWDKPKVGCAVFEEKFLASINDDLNMPKALAIMWDLVRSDYPTSAKAESLIKFDKILGLDLMGFASRARAGFNAKDQEIPNEILKLVQERKVFRKNKQFSEADRIRTKIREMGYDIQDRDYGKTAIGKLRS
ncbi:MAG: class I tRNA ligase family protein [Patescibacteria group bacterium]|nr:class I tRNA ligase family protein [Patescibacteria group bacterium]